MVLWFLRYLTHYMYLLRLRPFPPTFASFPPNPGLLTDTGRAFMWLCCSQHRKSTSTCSDSAPSFKRQTKEAFRRHAVTPGMQLLCLPDLLCLSTLLCRQIPEGLRFCSSRMGAAESSATDRGESCLVMPLCLLGQLPPGLHWMTDDREAPEKKEFASVWL